ncbi:MAG: LacI family DNA-binding transcriptional regulator [Anaerolineae bacterium]|nr:LacI family DNA-binding transcriptional regulator [Anaerolineae bacterium]
MMEFQQAGQPDDPRQITQQDVAERAGVSRAVVSYVVNNGPRVVSPDTRARVLKAIEELGYRPNKYAQRLKLQPEKLANGQIGIIMGGTSEILKRPYFGAVLAGIYQAAHRQGQQIRLVTFWEELDDPVFFNKNIHPEELSGLVLFTPYLWLQNPRGRDLLARVRERIDNIVCLEVVVDDLPAVVFDRAAAARLAVEHLIRLGHRRIAYAGSGDERLAGYRQTILDHGLPLEPGLMQQPNRMNSPEEGYAAAQTLLALPEPPTAIFADSDEVAIGVMGALHDVGLTVPDDMAIVAVDNTMLAAMVRPALTTVHVPKEGFGVYALQMLAMHGNLGDAQPASVVLPTELIVRDSCGAKRRAAPGS